MIRGGTPIADSSRRSVKSYVRAVRHPQVLSLTEERNSKIRRFGWEPITFSEEEEKGIIFPHSDPMIIRADIADFDVGRILIDTGSSVNVLFADAFNGLGIDPQGLNKEITPLLSFSGDVVEPIRSIQLPLAIDSGPRRTFLCTHFLVVNCPTAYNAIIGRPALTRMKAILSPHMLLLKFPTPSGIAQPAEELETISISDAQDRQVRIGTSLSPSLRTDFITFLRANSEVFAWSYNDMPGISSDVISHKLSISPSFKPVRQKRHSYDTERYEAMKTEVDKLQAIGFIREVTYPIWLANSVLVKKSDGTWRMCQDYTNLNKACPKDSFPLPRIDQLVDATAGHELLSFMDAYSGYNQIFMHPTDREHTAFITDRGLYCYNVMPFGLKNAGATYQRLVNRIFAELIGTSMEVYVDDMLVKSRTANDHLRNLSLMFGKLKQYNMCLNPSKCAFGVSSGKFLALIDMQVPRTKREVQSLTGRVAALAHFISKATDRCAPFFKALKGSKRQVEWTSECDRAFEDLKAYMSRAPLLSTPLPGEDLIIYLSVSASALSSVLIRRPNGIELPIFYMSHALLDAEQRYPQLEQLAYALILSARRLRPYFQAHSIDVLTNQPLQQFDIRYHPRPSEKGQAVADFISEFTLPIHPVTAPPSASTDPPSASADSPSTDGAFDQTSPHWTLYVDGSSNRQGSGAGLVLRTPDGTTIEYAIRFQFRASNNEPEYEALLAGLRLAHSTGAERLMICSDSQLVVNQVITEFAAKDESMAAYLAQTRRLLNWFKTYYIRQIPRSENSHADALSRLASAIDDRVGRHVPIEILT
ncbi:unnamed protein product [Prunus brigantina]